MIKSDQNPDPLLQFLDVFCFILCMLHVHILLSVWYSVKNRSFQIQEQEILHVCVR